MVPTQSTKNLRADITAQESTTHPRRPTASAGTIWPAEPSLKIQRIEGVYRMNWKEYYKQHLMSAEDAVNHIQSGNRVVVAHACGEPSYLLDVMVANAKATGTWRSSTWWPWARPSTASPSMPVTSATTPSLWAAPAGTPSPRAGATSPQLLL